MSSKPSSRGNVIDDLCSHVRNVWEGLKGPSTANNLAAPLQQEAPDSLALNSTLTNPEGRGQDVRFVSIRRAVKIDPKSFPPEVQPSHQDPRQPLGEQCVHPTDDRPDSEDLYPPGHQTSRTQSMPVPPTRVEGSRPTPIFYSPQLKRPGLHIRGPTSQPPYAPIPRTATMTTNSSAPPRRHARNALVDPVSTARRKRSLAKISGSFVAKDPFDVHADFNEETERFTFDDIEISPIHADWSQHQVHQNPLPQRLGLSSLLKLRRPQNVSVYPSGWTSSNTTPDHATPMQIPTVPSIHLTPATPIIPNILTVTTIPSPSGENISSILLPNPQMQGSPKESHTSESTVEGDRDSIDATHYDSSLLTNTQEKLSIWAHLKDFFRWPFAHPKPEFELPTNVDSSSLNSPTPSPTCIEAAVQLLATTVPRQVYLHVLLRLPSLYFSRVARIFAEADLTLAEIKEFALRTGFTDKGQVDWYTFESDNAQYTKLKSTWESFIDSVMREWKTFNLISVLLLTAIFTILQIQTAAQDSMTRYTALSSSICALISLLYGCMYIIRFGTMRKTYKAAEWALDAQQRTSAWWNIWILLAMPAIWLPWSIILYIICIMSFLWQTDVNTDQNPPNHISAKALLAVRVIMSCVLGLGIVYGVLILSTFRQYGQEMDARWEKRITEWGLLGSQSSHPPAHGSTSPPSGTAYVPQTQFQTAIPLPNLSTTLESQPPDVTPEPPPLSSTSTAPSSSPFVHSEDGSFSERKHLLATEDPLLFSVPLNSTELSGDLETWRKGTENSAVLLDTMSYSSAFVPSDHN